MDSSSDDQKQKQSDQQYTGSAKKPSKEVSKGKEKKGGKGKGAKKQPKDKEKKQAKEPKKKASKSKGKGVNIEKDTETVKQYLEKQNRPYNLLNIFDNLHGSIKKATLEIILDDLVNSQFLTRKDFGTNKVYFLNQSRFDVNEGEMEKLGEQLTEARVQHTQLQTKYKALFDEHKRLLAMKTDSQMIEAISSLKQQIKKLEAKKEKLIGGVQNKVSQEVVIKAEKEEDKIRRELKKLKAWKKDAVKTWSDLLEKKPMEVAQIMGIDM